MIATHPQMTTLVVWTQNYAITSTQLPDFFRFDFGCVSAVFFAGGVLVDESRIIVTSGRHKDCIVDKSDK